jgi:hypothetical protein
VGVKHSRQIAKLFLQSLELGLPHPLARVPNPLDSGGEGTLAYGSGVGRGSNSNEGIHPVVLKVYIRGLQRDVVYLC